MINARALSIAAVVAILSATGLAQAATDAKPAVEAATPAVATAEAKKPVVGKKRVRHHAKKKAAAAS